MTLLHTYTANLIVSDLALKFDIKSTYSQKVYLENSKWKIKELDDATDSKCSN